MERRMFLAVFLSIVVIFTFQSLFTPKQAPQTTQPVSSQVVEPERVTKEKAPTSAARGVEDPDFNESFSVVEDAERRVEFTNKGGTISNIYLKHHDYTVPANGHLALQELAGKQFEGSASGNRAVYTYKGNGLEVIRTFTLDKNLVILGEVTIRNTSGQAKELTDILQSFSIDLSKMSKSALESDWTLFEYSVLSSNKVSRKNSVHNFDAKWNREEAKPVSWFGFRDHYFATVAQPAQATDNFTVTAPSSTVLKLGTKLSRTLEAGEEVTFSSRIYAGPQRPELLEKAGKDFGRIFAFSDWGWLDAICKGLYWMLGALHKIVPSWGLCIILVSLIVYFLMYPLTMKSLRSMRKMQLLQPKVKQLQDKYKNSPEKMNQEVILLYKENNVNPLSGCLPMLLQMPIFYGLYQVLWRSFYFRSEGFLWMKDLAVPDHTLKLPFSLPYFGEYLNILPLIMVALMVVQQKLSSKNMVAMTPEQASQQKIMATLLPAIIGIAFYKFSSGLNLYFVVFYTLSAYTQWKISKETLAAA